MTSTASNTIATWTQDLAFRVDFPPGESLTLCSIPGDTRPGPGPNPMETVQAALAACTGIDVVLILQKMRKTLTSLRIEVETVRREEHPRIYTRIALIYHVEGTDLDADSLTRAVSLSQEKHCSVAAMLAQTVDLSYRIVLNGEPIPAPEIQSS
jgi:putative redox protein